MIASDKELKELFDYHRSFAENNPSVLPEGLSPEMFAARMVFSDVCEYQDIRDAEKHVEAIMKRHHQQQIIE